jgi:hypothetical protein
MSTDIFREYFRAGERSDLIRTSSNTFVSMVMVGLGRFSSTLFYMLGTRIVPNLKEWWLLLPQWHCLTEIYQQGSRQYSHRLFKHVNPGQVSRLPYPPKLSLKTISQGFSTNRFFIFPITTPGFNLKNLVFIATCPVIFLEDCLRNCALFLFGVFLPFFLA